MSADIWMHRYLPTSTTDREATDVHLQLYARLKSEGAGSQGPYGRPWTYDEAFALGRTFLAAHGRTPTHTHLKAAYGLPDRHVIERLFGSLEQFRVALLC